ncbi:hypothetical protein FHETE_11265, partial [Fusarium heterosporum]
MDRSRDERGLGRRKACDFCCQKKIRCDVKKPQCSGCSLHNVACVWTAAVRSQKSLPRQPPPASSSETRFESIEDRLKAIEAHIWRDNTTVRPATQATVGSTAVVAPSKVILIDEGDNLYDTAQTPDHDSEVPPTIGTVSDLASPSPTSDQPTAPIAAASYDTPLVQHPSAGEHSMMNPIPDFPLPTYHSAKASAMDYFRRFNKHTPLFFEPQFMHMFFDFYSFPQKRDKIRWSAINVVLALGLYMSDDKDNNADATCSMYINRAQSVMDSLVYRDEDLLGLQVILGVTIFFMHTAHPHPACVLIATAVKLVHRLKLHLPSQAKEHTRVSAEKARLFWITYTLDRDLSLRTSEPYLLQDRDIGITIENMSSGVEQGATLVPASGVDLDDAIKLDMPQIRARLAIIQGKIYDEIYSFQGMKKSSKEKQDAIENLDRMLDEWYSSLPARLRASKQRFAIPLHITYYQCIFSTRRASIHNTDWIKQLTSYTTASSYAGGHNFARSTLPLPEHWLKLVQAARSCLKLLREVQPKDTSMRWSSTCACEAAITILAAHRITLYRSEELPVTIDADALLINIALDEFEERIQGSDDEFLN